ncbi:UNVERIFIED_ORG: hypothetical protein ABIB63_004663 [Xanthomonas axonopodis]
MKLPRWVRLKVLVTTFEDGGKAVDLDALLDGLDLE